MFDDLYSILHTLMGIIAGIFPIQGISLTMLYIAYQYFEKEKWIFKRGDFVEYAIGVVIGAVIKYVLKI